jgi:hypothetical protein
VRSRVYERLWANALSLVWPSADRVERSGAGKYRKGDIEGTPPLHWSIKSGFSIQWENALGAARDEVRTRPELAGYIPAAGITVRQKNSRLRHYVLMERDDFLRLLVEHGDFVNYVRATCDEVA